MRERWRPIPRYPDFEACNVGGAIRRRAATPGGPPGPEKSPYAYRDHRGYWRIIVCMPGRRRNGGRGSVREKVAHLVLEAWDGPCPEPGWHACHVDDDSWNNDLTNLTWGSAWVNAQHKAQNARRRREQAARTECVA